MTTTKTRKTSSNREMKSTNLRSITELSRKILLVYSSKSTNLRRRETNSPMNLPKLMPISCKWSKRSN